MLNTTAGDLTSYSYTNTTPEGSTLTRLSINMDVIDSNVHVGMEANHDGNGVTELTASKYHMLLYIIYLKTNS